MKDKTVAARVVVSLPGLFSTAAVGLIHKRSEEMGVDACVYRGLPKSPPPQINNIEYEARQEMYSSVSVFAAIAKNSDGEITGDWIIKYLPRLKEREIEINLGLIGMNITDLVGIDDNLSFANTHFFSTTEQWLDYFFTELGKYSASK